MEGFASDQQFKPLTWISVTQLRSGLFDTLFPVSEIFTIHVQQTAVELFLYVKTKTEAYI